MVNHWYHLDQCRLVDRGLCFDMLSLGYLLLLHLSDQAVWCIKQY